MTIDPPTGTNNGGSADGSAKTHEAIRNLFQTAQRVLIASHIRPDGDAIGSVLGLGLALINQGKTVRMVLADGVPMNFLFLKGSDQIHRSAPADSLTAYDLTITVDTSDPARIGGVLNGREPDLNIDHHVTNPGFAKTNLILPDRVATAAIIAEFLPAWGLAFDTNIASALLTGIVTDTLGFRTSNITPQALRLAADLMEMGADLPNLYVRALVSKTYPAARYWGTGLEKLQRETIKADDGKAAVMLWTTLTLKDRQEVEYPGNDDADLVNILSTIEGDIAIIFVEQKNGHTKVSWRARPGYDVSQIALKFGGGGHPAAAGADIIGTLETVQSQVLEATRAALARTVKPVISRGEI